MKRKLCIFTFSIVFLTSGIFIGCDDATGPTEPAGNQIPVQPYSPLPENNSTGLAVGVDLSWQCYDPNRDSLLYDVYIGTSPDVLPFAKDLAMNSIDPGRFSAGVTYYWKVVARDPGGHFSISPTWRFTTTSGIVNEPPEFNADLSPTSVDGNRFEQEGYLSWSCFDFEGDPLTFNVYLGTTNPPPLIAQDLDTNVYYYEGLERFTTYYWRVVVRDNQGNSTQSQIISFTTTAALGHFKSERGSALDAYEIYPYLLLADDRAVVTLDISDPENPVQVSEWVHRNCYSLFVRENYCYVSDRVLDISDPTNVVDVGENPGVSGSLGYEKDGSYFFTTGSELLLTTFTDPFTISSQTVFDFTPRFLECRLGAINGDYMYLSARYYGGNEDTYGMVIMDISDVSATEFISYIEMGYNSISINMSVLNDHLYLSGGNSTTRIFDLADPIHPVEVGGLNFNFNSKYYKDGIIYIPMVGPLFPGKDDPPSLLIYLYLSPTNIEYVDYFDLVAKPDTFIGQNQIYNCSGSRGLYIYPLYGN